LVAISSSLRELGLFAGLLAVWHSHGSDCSLKRTRPTDKLGRVNRTLTGLSSASRIAAATAWPSATFHRVGDPRK
jgi:hypothetical protein